VIEISENKEIFILGMGRSWYSATKLLKSRQNETIITEIKTQNDDYTKEVKTKSF